MVGVLLRVMFDRKVGLVQRESGYAMKCRVRCRSLKNEEKFTEIVNTVIIKKSMFIILKI